MLMLRNYKKIIYAVCFLKIGSMLPLEPQEPLIVFSIGDCRGGPLGVQKSLLQGLEKIQYPYLHRPSNLDSTARAAVVISDYRVAQKAINLKKRGLIKYLFVGPNISYLPSSSPGVLKNPAIDVVLVPSEWVKNSYEQDAPSLKGKIKIWYAGIDTDYWAPTTHKNPTKNVLIYNKRGPKEFSSKIQTILKKYGYNSMVLTYGSHNQSEYKKMLEESDFTVIISPSESQGISMAEAWAMNVPTFIWEPYSNATDSFGNKFSTSSAPYLTKSTGMRWTNLKDFEALMTNIDSLLPTFEPRKWVIDNMTQEKSTALLLSIIESYIATQESKKN